MTTSKPSVCISIDFRTLSDGGTVTVRWMRDAQVFDVDVMDIDDAITMLWEQVRP